MKNESAAMRKMFVAGEQVSGKAGTIVSVNPATGCVNYEVSCASAEDVDRAVAVARDAARLKSWRELLPHQRAAILHRVSDRLSREVDHFAALQMRENGKVRSECEAQAKSAAATFRYYAGACETMESALTPPRGDYLSMSVHEPYGVVAAISPWNSPLTMEAQKVAPALAAGNAVILKPSEITPSTALELARVALEAGVPPGILNVLPGTGQVTGAALVAHPGVKMVSFTGGTETGKRIARIAAEKLMPVALELGGKSPHIIFADADLDAAVKAVATGIFEGSGQSCIAGSRLFVERPVYKRVVEAVVRIANGLRVDLPDAPGAQMGPIASFAHRDAIDRMVCAAREEGGEVLAGGGVPEDARLSAGAFYLPTVVSGLDNNSSLARREIFGPVLCVLPFSDEEDLVAQANDSVYGLAAGVWTADFSRAWRIARRLEAGTVWVNTYKQLSISTPFGGFKESGIGREKGLSGLRLYQQVKSVYFGFGE